MELISWNVNGIRACVNKGFKEFFEGKQADIFCIQETKCQEGQIELEFDGYYSFWNSAEKKGYSGTAIFSKIKPISVRYGIGIEEHDHEGRVITLEFEEFYMVNIYTPNSKRELERLEYRCIWEDEIRKYLLNLNKTKPVIMCGDLNVAHKEIDLKNPKTNHHNAGFTDEERGKMTELLQAGFIDSFRFLYPDEENQYTWWSYMGNARQKNIGWRIDYFIVSNSIKDKIIDANIYPAIFGSDHCPVGLKINLRSIVPGLVDRSTKPGTSDRKGNSMNEIKKNGKKWFYWFVLGVAIISFYKLLDNFPDIIGAVKKFLNVLSPFFIGILIAYILYIPSRKIESIFKKSKVKFIRKKSRTLSIACAYIIFIIIAAIVLNFIFPVLIESLTELISNIQWYGDVTIQKYQSLPEDSLLKSDFVTDLIKNVQNIDIQQYINIDKITEYAKGALNFVTSIIDIFVAVIVSIYILSERGKILKFLERLIKAIFSEKTYKNIEKYFNDSNEIFFGFLSSQIIDAVIVGILSTIAMSIMGIKYAPLLGFIIGLFNIIPYVGAIIAVVIAAIVTLITGGISQAIWMLVVVIILQQIDANIINPKIVGNTLKISPLLVMFAITIGGAYFGILGMFLAVPVAAVFKILLEDYITYKNSKNE